MTHPTGAGEHPDDARDPHADAHARAAADLSEQLMVTGRRVKSSLKAAARTVSGLEPEAVPLLLQLRHGPSRVTDLADCVHVDVTRVSRLASGLVNAGFLDKTPDKDDRRSQVLSLTDEGRAAVATLVAGREAWMRTLLHDWDIAAIEDFRAYLVRFGESVAAHPDRPI